MYKKIVRLFCLSTLISLFFVVNIFAVENLSENSSLYKIENMEKDTSENNTKINGVIPILSGESSIIDTINDAIDESYTTKIRAAASNRAKEIVFNYEIFENKNYISIILTSKVINATEKNEVTTINVDLNQEKIINLSEYSSDNAISIDIINKYIDYYKLNNKDNYNQNFSGVTQNSHFYINNNKLFLIFNLGDFKLNEKNRDILKIPYNEFNKFIVEENELYLGNNFKSKMVPLRKVAEAFDYKVSWKNDKKEIFITNGVVTSTIQPNGDTYLLNKKNIILENKPEIKNGITYVPLSYFSDVLGLAYSVYEDGMVFYKF